MPANGSLTASAKRRALALFNKQQYLEAGKQFAELCRKDPGDGEAWLLQGLCAQNIGRLDHAIPLLERAVALEPASARSHIALGKAWLQSRRVDRAIDAFRRAVQLRNDNAEAHESLCEALLAGGHFHEAVKTCRASRQAVPGSAQILSQLAFALEQTHQLDDARSAAREAVTLEPGNVRAHLVLARLDRRSGNLEAARERMQRVLRSPLPPVQEATLRAELGDVLDRMGDYDAAFRCFQAANQSLSKLIPPALAAQNTIFTRINRNREWFTRERVAGWGLEQPENAYRSPIFLVGFPRSGTTLTEQVFASLQRIVPTDERPFLGSLADELPTLAGRPASYPESLAELTAGELERLRRRYRELVQGMLPGFLPEEQRLLDKLPLNIIELGLVRRLFPDARVIVVLRDPRDCCLSCFMQPFLPNQAMVNFLTLEQTARFYAAVMDLWRHYRAELGLAYIEVRYEDLVEQFEPTARRLVDFVGEPWDDAVLKYFEHARKRDVRTPSYAAVASPIYSRAVGRWQHYHAQMEPVLDLLQPYVAEFGYT